MNNNKKIFRAIGVMSGTAMDGIDVALLTTDGEAHLTPGPGHTYPYPTGLRAALQELVHQPERAGHDPLIDLTQAVTTAHVAAIQNFLHDEGIPGSSIDLYGIHGQTVYHAPALKKTRQLGDGQALAKALGGPVVMRFREADIAAGGQGAPLMPLYHAAIVGHHPAPTIILNLGGVGNITYLHGPQILAFDTGPGNALLDDLMRERTGQPYDRNGAEAAKGQINHDLVARFLSQPYFQQPGPKSLDRQTFKPILASAQALPLADALATLAACTVQSACLAQRQVPIPAEQWWVTGGGRLNHTLMQGLKQALDCPVEPIETLGYSGDFLEAQGFAYLAVRSLLGLPLSLPTTTGVPQPLTGGVVYRPQNMA